MALITVEAGGSFETPLSLPPKKKEIQSKVKCLPCRLVDGPFSSISEDLNMLNLYIFKIKIIHIHTMIIFF